MGIILLYGSGCQPPPRSLVSLNKQTSLVVGLRVLSLTVLIEQVIILAVYTAKWLIGVNTKQYGLCTETNSFPSADFSGPLPATYSNSASWPPSVAVPLLRWCVLLASLDRAGSFEYCEVCVEPISVRQFTRYEVPGHNLVRLLPAGG